ncbi:MAG TPA: helix-turn-helix transcriptional regulator [Solirubrobacteraceae bacterium]
MSESPSPLGEFIRRQRELSEMSMREFARLAGISNPYLSQIERGLRAPSEQVLHAIAQTLKVSAETLYEQAGVPVEEPGPSKVVQAIRQDPQLSGRQRQALIQVYEAFVRVGARPRRSAPES